MKSKQSGFSMIEVLVTIVVISFGFLSLLSLQMRTLSNLTSNNQNSLAYSIANNMAERLLANRANSSFYNNIDTKNTIKDCSTVTNCTIVELDIWEFKQSVVGEGQLPAGAGTIKVLGGVADIVISWVERNGVAVSYALQVPL